MGKIEYINIRIGAVVRDQSSGYIGIVENIKNKNAEVGITGDNKILNVPLQDLRVLGYITKR